MKSELKRFLQLIAIFFKAFFTFKKKVWIFSIPSHPNLGDQAQLMCTEKWVRENYEMCIRDRIRVDAQGTEFVQVVPSYDFLFT